MPAFGAFGAFGALGALGACCAANKPVSGTSRKKQVAAWILGSEDM